VPYSLRLIEVTLASAAGMLYLAAGDLRVEGGAASGPLEPGRAHLAPKPGAAVAGASGARVLLEDPMGLDPRASWFLRCDRVDFDRGGIRCLLNGRLAVTLGEGTTRAMRPWDAWFESGKSSMMYVNRGDPARSKPRTYTVYVDEPIAL
jgi:hypothetical protein